MYRNSPPNRRRSSLGGHRTQYNRNTAQPRSRRGKQNIDPQRFIKAAKLATQVEYSSVNSFEDFKVKDQLKYNITSLGFTAPTHIQDKAIPLGLEGRDVVGIANTGTGKTLAFLLPLLNKLMDDRDSTAVVIAPTRELALQIQGEARLLSKGTKVFDTLIIGGVSMGRQLSELRRRPRLIIGTPGRMKDHIERGTLRLDRASVVVLDEVDRMLDMGFVRDIRLLLSKVPANRQSLFFSATMNPEIESLIKTFTHSPVTVMARMTETSDNVEQSIVHFFENSDKIDKLHDLLILAEVKRTLIFCETKRSTEKLSKELTSRGFASDAMHGNKSQGQRQRALKKFRDGEVEILVATDVAARGIDVDGITHVINYDVPNTYDDYTHRIGRTGRVGNLGYAVTFVTH